MCYMGSKRLLAKHLVPIIEGILKEKGLDTYVELMVGGANLIDKVHCKRRIGCDINENVIALLKYVQEDNDVSIAPDTCSKEHYADVRSNQRTGKYSPEYVSLIGYCASYGGRYFDGGYARNGKSKRDIYVERVRALKKQAPLLKDIEFLRMDYRDFPYGEYNALYYFDPPYKGTKGYCNNKFDHDEFYEFLRKLKGQGKTVLVSEYYMPSDFKCIWAKERSVVQRSDRVTADKAVEKLFTL